MNWDKSINRLQKLQEASQDYPKPMAWGIQFLDKATLGILPEDLWLVGAPTGVGKTQLCMKVALTNIRAGKKVHFIALEAQQNEIEQRMLFTLYSDAFYADPDRKPGVYLRYRDWKIGKYDSFLPKYTDLVNEETSKFTGFSTFYRTGKFGIKEFNLATLEVSGETDLIILDHIHYFDYEDQNENKALKEITMEIREINQVIGKPMIVIAHLRKRDRFNKDLVAGLDEFHGSSDLTKIATGIISIGKGEMVMGTQTKTNTYFRVNKCRDAGDLTHYVGKIIFDSKKGDYESTCTIGKLSTDRTEWTGLTTEEVPWWMKE